MLDRPCLMVYDVITLIFKVLNKADNFSPLLFYIERPPMLGSKILYTTKYFADFSRLSKESEFKLLRRQWTCFITLWLLKKRTWQLTKIKEKSRRVVVTVPAMNKIDVLFVDYFFRMYYNYINWNGIVFSKRLYRFCM